MNLKQSDDKENNEPLTRVWRQAGRTFPFDSF